MFREPLRSFPSLRLLFIVTVLMLVCLFPARAADAQVTPAAPLDTPTLFAETGATGLTLANDYAYWYTSCGGDFYPARSFLSRRRVDAGLAAQERYSSGDCINNAVASYNVAVDEEYLYWLMADGRVVRQGVDNRVEELARTFVPAVGGFPSCCGVAVDGDYLYWSEPDRIARVPVGGGTRETVYTAGSSGAIFDLRGGDGTVYFRQGTRLLVLRPSGAGMTPMTVQDNVVAYALNSSRVFFGVALGRNAYLITSARRSDLGGRRIEHVSDTVGRPRLTQIAVDETNLYFHDRRGTSVGGPIFRMPLSGGEAVQITAYLLNVNHLQAEGGRLFWLAYNEGVYSLLTVASAIPRPNGDLVIQGAQVTQVIQTEPAQIPLIGHKPTAVRIFARGVEDSNGPWTDVVARVRIVETGQTYQSYPFGVSPTGSDVNTLADSGLVILRGADTAPGTRTVVISIGSSSGRPEALGSNNTLTRTLTFAPPLRMTVYGMPYGNINNGPGCDPAFAPNGYIPPFSNFEPHRLYMENLFPLSQLTILPLPGNPRRTFDNTNCNAPTLAHDWMARYMADAFPAGGRYGYLLIPDSTGYYGWCCSGLGENLVAQGQDLRPDPGPTLAHEMGHARGRPHTFEDPNYARDNPALSPLRPGSMGPYLGFRLASNAPMPRPEVIRGETDTTTFFGDIMSYHVPFWISPYTYCRLADTLSGGATTCPPGLDGIPAAQVAAAASSQGGYAAQAAEYLFVSGYMDAGDDVALWPFEHRLLDVAPPLPTGSHYSVALGTANDPFAYGTFSFDIPELEQDWPNNPYPETIRRFGFYVPWDPNVELIQFFSIEDPFTPIAVRTVSASAPQITTLDVDLTGQPVTGKRAVAWDVTDADQDPLTYSLWYRPASDHAWLPVDVLNPNTSATVDFDSLPGGPQAQLRLLASDGVRTVEAFSPQFAVPDQLPIITATTTVDDDGYLVAAFANARDWNDGALEDLDAYVWTSNWQGEVGRGPWLSAIDLLPGEHLLIIAATDSAKAASTVTLPVRIRDQVDLSGGRVEPGVVTALEFFGPPVFSVSFPNNALAAPLNVTLAEPVTPTIPTIPGVVGSVVELNAYEDDGTPVTQFQAPVTLRADFSAAMLGPAAQARLTLARWDAAARTWVAIPSTLVPNTKTIESQLTGFSIYALIVWQPSGDKLYLPSLNRPAAQ